jgi:hypothetical protein
MSDKQPNSLTSLRTVEVSLVPKGAVRKRFAIFKGEETMPAFDEVLKAVLDTKIEGEDKIDEIMKAAQLSEKAAAAAKGALRLLSGFKDEIPQDVFAKLSECAGYNAAPMADEKLAACGSKDDAAKKSVQKSIDELPAEVKAEFEKITKATEDANKRADEVQKSLDAEKAIRAKETDERVAKELTEQAKADFGAFPAKPEEIAAVLKASDEPTKKSLAAMFKAANEVISKSKLLEEVGKSTPTVEAGGSAWAKIEAAASAIVQKSENKQTHAQAVDSFLRTADGRALYQEFLAEKK